MSLFVLLIFVLSGIFTLFLLYIALVWLPKEMHEAYRGAFRTLAMAVEERQPVMTGHAVRVSHLAVTIASRLGISSRNLRIIEYAALLHDIGKVSIPYLILNSSNPLSSEQQEKLKEHADEGATMLMEANTMKEVIPLVLHHHHRYDELLTSYSLPGEMDLLYAQVIAVANAIDSMLNGTSGFTKMTRSMVIGHLWQGSGTLYHPRVVEVVTKIVMEEGEIELGTEPAEVAA